MTGAFLSMYSAFVDQPKLVERFRSGEGLAWGDHHHALFEGTERLFAPGYRANLVASWIPALHGVEEKLQAGADVADVGCGHGASTIIMARAFPASRIRQPCGLRRAGDGARTRSRSRGPRALRGRRRG
jgi:hypothetical protein